MRHRVFLGLGTNLGDREANLSSTHLALEPALTLTAASPIYQTSPWGYVDQPDFLNQVLDCRTDLPPADLLERIKEIESKIGRQPTFRYGPRQIDIDILLYDDLIFSSPSLQIPHPAMHERAFVLVPLCDLVPDLIHPKLSVTLIDLLDSIDTDGVEPYVISPSA